jgi:hypothetical protein
MLPVHASGAGGASTSRVATMDLPRGLAALGKMALAGDFIKVSPRAPRTQAS